MRAPDDRPSDESDGALLSSAQTRAMPSTGDEPPPAPAPASPAPPLAVPTKIRQFTVLQQVGQGGMGVVFSAYDNELDRKVAIKLLRPSQGDRMGRARLHREAQAMARLAHPNIVRVYEVGQLEGHSDLVYLVMEFVQGDTLRRWLRHSRRPWREVLAVMLQAGRGLAAAHAAGLVHRDFKPDNVIVAEDGFVRVLDFGLARSFESVDLAAASSSTRAPAAMERSHNSLTLSDQLTQAGTVIGTPAYMSPEQFSSRVVDAQSDQFSFCIALYEALYRERPFTAKTGAELHLQIGVLQTREPPRKTGVPSRLRRVVLRGLAAAPQERWPSMQALLTELAREPGKQAKLWLAGAGIAAVAAALALTLAPRQQTRLCQDAPDKLVGVWDETQRNAVEQAMRKTGFADAGDVWRRVSAQLDTYTARWVAMARDSCEATHVRGEQSPQLMDLRTTCLHQRRTELALLVDGLTRADSAMLHVAVQATMGLGDLDRCADVEALRAAVPPPDDPAEAAAVEAVRDKLTRVRVTGSLGQFEQSRALMAEVVAETTMLGYRPLQAEALVRQADLLDLAGEAAASERLFTDAYFTAGIARHDQVQAEAAISLVFVAGAEQAKYDEALVWDRHARMVLERMGNPPALQINRLNGLGTLMERRGDFAAGLAYLKQALALAEADADSEPLKLATVLLNAGSLYLMQSDFTAAEQHYLRSLKIFTRILGPNNPAIPDCLNNLGQVALLRADLPAAERYFLRSIEVWELNMGPMHPRLTYPLENLGSVAMARRDYVGAQRYLARSLTLLETVKGPDDLEVAQPLGGLAELAAMQGDWAQAERHGARSMQIYEKAHGPEHPYLVQPLCALGEAALGQRHFKIARTHLERALQISETTYGASDLAVLPALDALGRLALAERQPAAALAPLERAAKIVSAVPTLPDRRARIHFALARALVDSRGDRTRAAALARDARDDYATAGERFTPELAEVTTWLAAHPG